MDVDVDVSHKLRALAVSPQVRGLRHLSAGAVRGPAGGGDIPADQIFWE